jgi:hypothetical protein
LAARSTLAEMARPAAERAPKRANSLFDPLRTADDIGQIARASASELAPSSLIARVERADRQ